MLKPLCAYCRARRVSQWAHVHCSKRCAWEARGGKAWSVKSLGKANGARRARYVARLKARLKGLRSPAAIWAKAYAAGFQACWQGYLRRVRAGEIVELRPRRRLEPVDN